MQHPQVGELHLHHDKLDIPGSQGQQLVVFHAQPGTDFAQALALLGSIVATDAQEEIRQADDLYRSAVIDPSARAHPEEPTPPCRM